MEGGRGKEGRKEEREWILWCCSGLISSSPWATFPHSERGGMRLERKISPEGVWQDRRGRVPPGGWPPPPAGWAYPLPPLQQIHQKTWREEGSREGGREGGKGERKRRREGRERGERGGGEGWWRQGGWMRRRMRREGCIIFHSFAHVTLFPMYKYVWDIPITLSLHTHLCMCWWNHDNTRSPPLTNPKWGKQDADTISDITARLPAVELRERQHANLVESKTAGGTRGKERIKAM